MRTDQTGTAGNEYPFVSHDLSSRDMFVIGSFSERQRINFAGTPATTEKGSTSETTTAPAPTIAPFPMVTPGRMVAFVPISASAPMRTGLISRSVRMIGTSSGNAVWVEPSTLAPGPHPTESSITRSRASK
ncbi:hypothetical protein RHECNPAF_2190077 [Rhizobium etli CNPAF512]|nr:hypothetical protein RHECNPAF_2190077 [Rhizobium etli CNPAF512]